MTMTSPFLPRPVPRLAAVLAGILAAFPPALLLWRWSPELALLPLLLLPGAIAGYLRGRDGSACGAAAGVLAALLALIGLFLLRGSAEPRTALEYLADWGYHGLGLVLGNTVAGMVGTLLREERGD